MSRNAIDLRQGDAGRLIFSYAYLGLPLLIFGLGWLRPGFGAILFAVVLIGFMLLIRQLRTIDVSDPPPAGLSLRQFTPIAAILFCWSIFSGIGGFGFQNSDWIAHNGLLNHLSRESWPLILHPPGDPTGEPFYYVYYVAFYLPAALVGKLAGWTAANVALFLWAFFGLLLAMAWFLRLLDLDAGTRGIFLVAPVFALFSGLDIVGWVLVRGGLPELGEHIEWWTGKPLQYSSISTLLFWVPQHAIAAWILTGVTMFYILSGLAPISVGVFYAFSALWTPFAVVGALPFAVLALVIALRRHRISEVFSLSNLVLAPLALAPVALFITANTFSFPFQFAIDEDWPSFLRTYSLFILLEIGVFIPPLWFLARDRLLKAPHAPWFWVSVFVFLALPLIVMGFANDIVMRGSIPAFFVLGMLCAYALLGTGPMLARLFLIAALCVGAMTPLAEIVRSAQGYTLPPPQIEEVRHFLTQRDTYVIQRKGDREAFFFRTLARTNAP
ncbi:hypothetical protein [Tropicimonas sediminicola]|uniref:Uncharacterized protein n=1 Tax=Tropicimonas sediminicola TaxID=1031541 RepID=A0A239LAM4_9RHOB|nr:hypothetical protein [Tropicimonas sediminicola]SNT27676.1 hypothetical protein SAMN05421757_109101 [Tropicimonas sediminicola]